MQKEGVEAMYVVPLPMERLLSAVPYPIPSSSLSPRFLRMQSSSYDSDFHNIMIDNTLPFD